MFALYMGVGCNSLSCTHTYTQWVTHLLPCYAGDVFLFLAQIEFPVPDSAARGARQHNSPFPGAVSLPGSICNTDLRLPVLKRSLPKCWLQGGGHRGWEDGGCLVNLWRIWNCQVIVMLWHWIERTEKQLLAEDWNWETGKGKVITDFQDFC